MNIRTTSNNNQRTNLKGTFFEGCFLPLDYSFFFYVCQFFLHKLYRIKKHENIFNQVQKVRVLTMMTQTYNNNNYKKVSPFPRFEFYGNVRGCCCCCLYFLNFPIELKKQDTNKAHKHTYTHSINWKGKSLV